MVSLKGWVHLLVGGKWLKLCENHRYCFSTLGGFLISSRIASPKDILKGHYKRVWNRNIPNKQMPIHLAIFVRVWKEYEWRWSALLILHLYSFTFLFHKFKPVACYPDCVSPIHLSEPQHVGSAQIHTPLQGAQRCADFKSILILNRLIFVCKFLQSLSSHLSLFFLMHQVHTFSILYLGNFSYFYVSIRTSLKIRSQYTKLFRAAFIYFKPNAFRAAVQPFVRGNCERTIMDDTLLICIDYITFNISFQNFLCLQIYKN